MRVCSQPGCPELIPKPGYCTARGHAQQKERARGTRQERGYDANHVRLRADWAPKVATGKVNCWRCGEPIAPTEPWDLGHDDNDRRKYRGPEHAHRCNRAAAGRASHQR